MNYASQFSAPVHGPGHYGAPAWYGGTAAVVGVGHAGLKNSNGLFIRGQRQRMNIVPIILSILIPWGLFCIIFAVLGFSYHYEQPLAVWTFLLISAVAVLFVLYFAMAQRVKRSSGEREPSWLMFMFVALVIAWVSGFTAGDALYYTHTKMYYDQHQLNTYFDVYPNRARGQQIMDAGSIVFTNGSHIDVQKSMGFKNMQVYCVAPIVLGTDKLTTYDFWAVGRDCCSGNAADFHCDHFKDPNARGGLRVMTDDDRPFYRLAVQQAEATYNIKATHPLFFSWVPDAQGAIEELLATGEREYVMGVCGFLLWQMFIVAAATVAFSQIR